MAWDIPNIIIELKKKIGLVNDRTSQIETGLAAIGSYGDEVLVGKWGDGDLFRKVVNLGALAPNTEISIDSGLSNVTVRTLTIFANDNNYFFALPWFTTHEGTVGYTRTRYEYSTNKIKVANVTVTDFSNALAVIEYTKNPPTRDVDDIESEIKK